MLCSSCAYADHYFVSGHGAVSCCGVYPPPQNRATGDCYVQMKSEEAAAKVARRLHKTYMGQRYIEIFKVNQGVSVS